MGRLAWTVHRKGHITHLGISVCPVCSAFCLDLVVHVVKWILLALVDRSIGPRELTVTHFRY